MWFIRSRMHALRAWLDHKLRLGVYELQGDEVVSGRGRRPGDRIKADAITAWRLHPEMGFDIIEVELGGDRSLIWFDKYDDLIGILRRVAGDREMQAAVSGEV